MIARLIVPVLSATKQRYSIGCSRERRPRLQFVAWVFQTIPSTWRCATQSVRSGQRNFCKPGMVVYVRCPVKHPAMTTILQTTVTSTYSYQIFRCSIYSNAWRRQRSTGVTSTVLVRQMAAADGRTLCQSTEQPRPIHPRCTYIVFPKKR